MEKVSERIPTGNKYPIQMSTVYPGIWIEVHNDFELINALDNRGNVARSLLVRKFFPDASPEEVCRIIGKLKLTGQDQSEFDKITEYADNAQKEAEQEADRKKSIMLQEEIINNLKKTNNAQHANVMQDKEAYRMENEHLKNKTQLPIDQDQAADCIRREAKRAGVKRNSKCSTRSIQQWESGDVPAPVWYPGRNCELATFAVRVRDGFSQEKIKQTHKAEINQAKRSPVRIKDDRHLGRITNPKSGCKRVHHVNDDSEEDSE